MTPTQKQHLALLIRALKHVHPVAEPDGLDKIARYVDTLVVAEREACARLATTVSVDLAKRIRARERKAATGA